MFAPFSTGRRACGAAESGRAFAFSDPAVTCFCFIGPTGLSVLVGKFFEIPHELPHLCKPGKARPSCVLILFIVMRRTLKKMYACSNDRSKNVYFVQNLQLDRLPSFRNKG